MPLNDPFKTRRDVIALEFEDGQGTLRSLTFAEVDARANRMARALLDRGLGRGDRCGVHLANGVEFLDLFIACTRLGIIFVPINVLYREREIAHIAADAAPRLTVTTAVHQALFPGNVLTVDVEELARQAEEVSAKAGDAEASFVSRDDPAAIVYTSGTTGRSKGAVLTHGNFAANTANIVDAWRITSDDRYLAALPLFHVHGLGNGVCAWLASGCRMRLVERFDRQHVVNWFEAFQPTLFFGVPTMYVRLLEIPPDTARRIGQHMRLFVSGSAPLPPQVLEAFRELYGHAILERYGMSETLMLTSNPYEGERRAGTVGLPLPGVSVRLAGADGRDVAASEIGQVLVRGPNVFPGYWNDPVATAAAFGEDDEAGAEDHTSGTLERAVSSQPTADGLQLPEGRQEGSGAGSPVRWFRTGDLAERSADGYYTLRGRATDLIISGGFNIYPREIEELLLEQPGVREAAVVGAPDQRRGEVPVAYVVTDAAFNEAAARDACVQALASFKVPRAFVCVETLPRNALGKVQKHLLPAWAGGGG